MINNSILLRYKKLLPVTAKTPLVTLGEGNTPLIRSPRLEKEIGCGGLYYKLEGCNPTGSFKDRGMVVAMAKAVEEESLAVICASTGNTSASAAAYAASFGLDVFIIIPEGKIALGKLAQAIVHGAKIISIDGNFDQALTIVRNLTRKHPVTMVNSLNPYRIEGQKTAAFEIVDDLSVAPDYLFIPVGNAGNITAYWKGFCEYKQLGKIEKNPRMMGFQAEGAAPIVRGYAIDKPETIATAIRIGNPASWSNATTARDESGGAIDMVSDKEILAAYHYLASKEGIFCEPASAASVAGLLKLSSQGVNFRKNSVVCILTGSGLKDADTATRDVKPFTRVSATTINVEQALGWG
jgi:threonine synthase